MKFQSTLVRRGNGSVGNLTVTGWKGKLILKSKASEVANPQTDAQMKQRAKFKLLSEVASMIAVSVKRGFKEVATAMTEFNYFVKTNSGNGYLAWDGSAWISDVSKLEISKGSLDIAPITTLSGSNNNVQVTVGFSTTATGNQSSNDKLCCIVSAGDGIAVSDAVVSRSAGTATLQLSAPAHTGDSLEIHAYFVSADGKRVSDTYFKTVTI